MADSGSQRGAPPPYQYQQPLEGQVSNEYAPYPHLTEEQKQQQQGDQRWGTPVMGQPSNPDAHPDNQNVATGQYTPQDKGVARSTPGQSSEGSPYVQQANAPAPSPGNKGTMDNFRTQVAEYGQKAGVVINNIKGHLMTGKVTDTAWGRVTAGTQLISKGGFEGVFKATFAVDADEKLKKTYACFLSTSTGPVAGTLYISTKKFAFCSDRPLSYTPPPGQQQQQQQQSTSQGQQQQQAFSYYKVIIPLHRVKEVTPSVNQTKPEEKYIQIATKDSFEFWFMGFVNYDKGVLNTKEAVASAQSDSRSGSQVGQQPYPPQQYGQQQQPYPPNQPSQQEHFSPNQYGTQ